jgi:photosystem II stability/assembly factor-like uncharacterized protein
MAKAGLLYAGTDDGVVVFSDPGGGGRWRRIVHTLQGQAISSLLALDALHILAAGREAGIQQSTDGGRSWQQVSAEQVVALYASPDDAGTLYAITEAGEVRYSSDGGAEWLLCEPPPEPAIAFMGYQGAFAVLEGAAGGVAAVPEHPDLLFAVAGGRIYRMQAGSAWEALALPWEGFRMSGALAVLAGRPSVVLAAGSSSESQPMLVRSEDDGARWQAASVELPLSAVVTVLAPVSHHQDYAWAGTAAGRLLFSADRGRTWQQPIAQHIAPVRSLLAVRLA